MKEIIKTDLDAVTYASVVDEIVDNHFNTTGEYIPHYGLMSVMCTFYNTCVIESKIDAKINHEMSLLEIVNVLSADKSFMVAFNDAICMKEYRLDFANAYRDAMEIVYTKKSSLNYAVDRLVKSMDSIVEKILPVVSEENVNKLSSIADVFKNGDINLVDAFTKSDRFKEILAMPKEK